MSAPRHLSILTNATEDLPARLRAFVAPADWQIEVIALPSPAALSKECVDLDDPRLLLLPAAGRTRAAELQAALALARGPWLLLLEPGDRLADDALARLLGLAATREVDAVFAGVASVGEALTALVRDPRALAGSLLRLDVLRSTGAPSEAYRSACELDVWLRVLPALRGVGTTSPTLLERSSAAVEAPAARERAIALARAFGETPPLAWGLTDASGRPLGESEACAALARLAACEPDPVRIGVGAMLWRRASSLAGIGGEEGPGEVPESLARALPGLAAPSARVPSAAARCGTAVDADFAVVFEVRALDRGGLESVVVDLALGLAAAQVRVAVVCTEQGGTEVARLRAGGIEVKVLSASDRAAELGVWLDQHDIDLWNASSSAVGVPLAVERGIPVVLTLHGADADARSGPHLDLAALDPHVDAYVASSSRRALKDVLRDRRMDAPAFSEDEKSEEDERRGEAWPRRGAVEKRPDGAFQHPASAASAGAKRFPIAAERIRVIGASLDADDRASGTGGERTVTAPELLGREGTIAETCTVFREVVAATAARSEQRLRERIAAVAAEQAMARRSTDVLRGVVRDLLGVERAWQRERLRLAEATAELAAVGSAVQRAAATLAPAALALEQAGGGLGVARRLRAALRAALRRPRAGA